jgi:hypothetical protein
MENDYENVFSNCFDGVSLNLFRDQSQELEKLFTNKPTYYVPGHEKDFELQIDEYRVDKSDTKSNSHNPSPNHQFDVKSKKGIIKSNLIRFFLFWGGTNIRRG